jgi:hypothetical protein
MSRTISIDQERGLLIIGEKQIDLNVLEAICDPNHRLLWQFSWIDGVVKAVPYDESRVLWIEPKG